MDKDALAAYRRLRRTLKTSLDHRDDYTAAQTLLRLVRLCHAYRNERAYGALDPPLRVLCSPSSILPRQARKAVAFAAHAARAWGESPYIAEVLSNTEMYLEASRYRPDLEFLPTLQEPLIHLEWDQLEPPLRQSLCREIGVAETLATCPADGIDPSVRDWLTWSLEVVRRVRVTFLARS
jgi:hypothetical protein